MEMQLPPSSTNGKSATVPSLPLSPGISEVVTEKPIKNLAKVSSAEQFFHLMLRLDTSGFLLILCLLSMFYVLLVSWVVWSLLDQPVPLFWRSALLVCLLLFVWTISVSNSPGIVVSQFTHMLLLSCTALHFLGPSIGMFVMYMSTLYAASLLGHSISCYCRRSGIDFVVKPPTHNEGGASMFCTVISAYSFVCFVRLAWMMLTPDTRTFLEAFDRAIEMWVEVCSTIGLWTLHITQFDLGGAILSIDTFAWAAPTFLCGGLFVGVSLFLANSDAAAVLFFWIEAMVLMGLFGYVLQLRSSKIIIASCHPSTKWAQRADQVCLTVELAAAKDVMLSMKPDGHFNFSAKGCDGIQYELQLELFGAMDVEKSMVAVVPGTICYLIKKAERNWWPRLFKKEGKPPVFLNVDLNKWKDKDNEDTEFDYLGDMVFMKLHKGGDNENLTIPSCHLSTKWAQRANKVCLTVDLADAKNVMLNMKPDGHFNFSAKGGYGIQYALHLELFGAIDVEHSTVAIVSGTICYLLKKAESNWWPRLLKKEGEPPVFLKVDVDKWQDEDNKDTEFGDFGDMAFVKLDKVGDDEDSLKLNK